MRAPAATDIHDAAAIEVWAKVIQGFQTTNRRLHADIKAAFNLNEAETETLLHLHRHANHRAPMAVLARAALFSTGGFTKVADKLTARGLTERVACLEDRRVTYLELTEDGAALGAELARLVADTNRARFIGILGPERAHQLAQAMSELHHANQDPSH